MDRTELKNTMKELLEDSTGKTVDNLDDPIDLRAGLGLDSVDIVTLVLDIQNRFRIMIDSRELVAMQTIGQLLDLLQAKLSNGPRPSAA